MKKRLLIILIIILLAFVSLGQTVVEMSHPGDADVILLQVLDSTNADVNICITKNKKNSKKWDCMWKFRKWGLCNFSVYITKDPFELYVDSINSFEGEPLFYPYHAKVYFTVLENERGYMSNDFFIPGVMRVRKK